MHFCVRKWISAVVIGFLALAVTAASAQEAQIKRAVEARYGLKVESVKKTTYLGMYEVVVMASEREIVYTDATAAYLFSGHVFDLKNRRNLTQERLDRLTAIKFDDLPLELAIKQVRGNGKRVVAVFSDPFCPYCKQLDQSINKLDDVTIYTFLYPILRKDESPAMSTRIWCSPDRSKAYLDWMLRNRQPAALSTCTAPVDKWIALGEKLGVQATPVTYVSSGIRVVGARFEDVQRAMDEAEKSQ